MNIYSHGKLLISGEYVVLAGAKAFAVATRFGQSMRIRSGEKGKLKWSSSDEKGKQWFNADYHGLNLKIQGCSDLMQAEVLRGILCKAMELNEGFNPLGHELSMELEFPRNWGLGSSSTLICNIAKWAEVDAFVLSESSFGGSGVDIAVGMVGSELIYQRPPAWDSFVWNPPFADKLWFIHLNRKQDSRESIKSFDPSKLKNADIDAFNHWTEEMVLCKDVDSFQFIMSQHENKLSELLERKTVKALLFPDYPHAIKSLGGWGGDFVMAVGDYQEMNYFREKGFVTIIPFKEMVHH